MDDDELLDIAAKLEASTSIDDAKSQLSDGKPWLFLAANRDALLHVASVCLTAATAPVPDDTDRSLPHQLEHHQITDSDADHYLGSIQRLETFPPNPERIAERESVDRRRDTYALFGCATFVCIVIAILASSAMYWWHLLTGTPLR